jgi:translation initiation factor eIF-2B subunit epsilon
MAKGAHKRVDSSSADDVTSTKREQPLQAILLADSFTNSFRPLSLDRPKVLSPLNNVPMINYALDFLSGAGAEQVFVVCTSDAVERHVVEYPELRPASTMVVQAIKDSSLTNVGDALREMDKRNLIQSDPFVLMFGDTITNANLAEAIRSHKERHRNDSAAIMTILFKPVGSNGERRYCYLRSTTEDLIVGLDPTQSNRILLYHDSSQDKTSRIPCSFFQSHPAIDLRSDLLDIGLDLCSPDVLARLADEFDYRDLRRQFVANSVAEEEEGLQNRLHAHFLRDHEYAARVTDLDVYASVSADLLRRFCYPIVPDQQHATNSDGTGHRNRMQRHYVYQECSGKTRLARSCKIIGPVLMGQSCWIGENATVQSSVLGHHCRLEESATLIHSHLWDGAHVEQGAQICYSVLGDGAIVRKGAVVNRGCVIGAGVVIGSGCVVPEFSRLTLKADAENDELDDDDWGSDDEDEDESKDGDSSKPQSKVKRVLGEPVSDPSVVGPDGKGHLWNQHSDNDKTEVDEDNDSESKRSADIFAASKARNAQTVGYTRESYYQQLSLWQEEDDDDLSDDDQDMLDSMASADLSAYNTAAVTFDDTELEAFAATSIIGRQKGVDVVKELTQICLEYEDTAKIENLAIELNAFKFSQNATYSDCTMAATLAILEKLNIHKGVSDGKIVADFKAKLERWAPLLRKFSIGLGEEKAIVLALEKCAISDNEMGAVLSTGRSFRFLIQTLHDEEIVSEDAILSWAVERREITDESSPAAKLFALQPVQDFLEWLAESEEDDSDDDEDEEED